VRTKRLCIDDRIVRALKEGRSMRETRTMWEVGKRMHDEVIIDGPRRIYKLLGTVVAIYRPLCEAQDIIDDIGPGELKLGVEGGDWDTSTMRDRIHTMACAFKTPHLYVVRGKCCWSDNGSPYTGPRIFKVGSLRHPVGVLE